jgi:hypothetical protein
MSGLTPNMGKTEFAVKHFVFMVNNLLRNNLQNRKEYYDRSYSLRTQDMLGIKVIEDNKSYTSTG